MRIRLACLATLVFTGNIFAQPLADLVPAESLLYIGWKGTAEPGKGYADTKLAAVLKDAQLGRVIDETLPAVGAAAAQKWPRYAGPSQATTSVLRQLIRRPSAVFLEFEDGQPRGGFLCRAGTDAKQLTQALDQLVAQLPAMLKARVVTPGDSVGLVLGFNPDDAVEGGLAGDELFRKATSHCMADPEVAAFINVKRAREVIADAVNKNASPENIERFQRFMDASGLDGLNAFASADGFVGRDWQSESFIDTPSPRKGLLNTGVNVPIDPDLLKRVPASANVVTAMRVDLNAAVKTIRDVAAATDPAAGDAVDKAIGAATMAIGKNLQNDLLASLGNQWAVYASPEIGGSSLAGMVVVNKLANPLKAKQSIAATTMFFTNTAQNLLRQQRITVAMRSTKVGDLTIYYAATPLVAPAWTIKDGYLYVGMYPQTVIAAARYAGATIAEKPAFKAALADKAATPISVSYTDVKATMADGYAGALAVSRTVFGLSDLFLAATPEPVLPPLAALLAEATPATEAVWADDDGLHSRTVTPFPGAVALANFSLGNVLASNIPTMVGTLLPALNRAHVAADRIKSSSNLRQIGLACLMYANENRDQFPPDFAALLKTQDISAEVFLSPERGKSLPPLPPGARPAEFYGPWVMENSDFVYVGKGKKSGSPADQIVAYEKPLPDGEGINVLFVDGHVDWVAMPQVPATFAGAGLQPPQP